MKYIAIHSEGGLIPYDLLEKIANEDAPGQKAADFGLAKGRRLSDEIQRVWSDAQDLWDIFRRRRESLPEKDPHGTTLTRERWIVPLLTDAQILGYELKFQPAGVELHGLNFPVSHWAGEGDGGPPVHIEGFKVELDRKGAKLRTSPRAMVQEFLNHSEAHLWGIVTNGLSFRLLRDSARTARSTYLEFDLESILEGNRFSEFAIFYRLTRPELKLTKKDEQQVKRVAAELLQTLKKERLVLDWRKKQQTRAAVRVCIEKTLDQLPRVFSGELYREKCELTYQHVYDSYFGLGSSVYESRGGSGAA